MLKVHKNNRPTLTSRDQKIIVVTMITKRSSTAKAPQLSTQTTSDDNDKYVRHGVNTKRVRYAFLAVVIMLCLAAARVAIFFDADSESLRPIKLKIPTTESIPPCEAQPWKQNEDMRGKCPGDLKPFVSATTISDCATTCCSRAECITWQFRKDTGCLQGGDVRLGMEKDGVSAWCSDHPPQRWQGQYLYKKGGSDEDNAPIRKKGCDAATWNPSEQVGQCFGLGDVKTDASGSAEECRDACCKDDKCRAWQWNKELGCFYSSHMHGCQGEGDPIQFEPFVGRRKLLQNRKYTDNEGKPWTMTL